MFEIIKDSEFLFNYLNNHFNNRIQFIDEEYFIINESDIYLIVYVNQSSNKELIGFKIKRDTPIQVSGLQLLTYLEEQASIQNPFFGEAAEGWHQFLLNLKSDKLFFDAH